ncbi:hypothetical protein Y032_0276g1077 [Ancylostoma ceylanicum]|uniref:Uncharacterized protein n=1 Tax=Ancylostoma ceylanicum TaxID=53326 RepID=A0A016S7E8_9BILA|nr:hypothetical protein Y032_0276g1077 [Ancylostoma ceylanicum]
MCRDADPRHANHPRTPAPLLNLTLLHAHCSRIHCFLNSNIWITSVASCPGINLKTSMEWSGKFAAWKFHGLSTWSVRKVEISSV